MIRSFLLAALSLGVVLTGSLSFAAPQSSRVERLKASIEQIALQNMTNIGSRPEVRRQLDKMIVELRQEAGAVNEAAWVRYAPGSWQQIWSDERDMSPPNAPQQNLAQIYQYVSVEGWGYNFGERLIPGRGAVTFALAVQGSVQGHEQTTEITKAYFRASELLRNEDIEMLSVALQNGAGESVSFVEREAGKFPNGPIGAKGVLSLEFLDQDLKIGYTRNVYTQDLELFVMKRVQGVIKTP